MCSSDLESFPFVFPPYVGDGFSLSFELSARFLELLLDFPDFDGPAAAEALAFEESLSPPKSTLRGLFEITIIGAAIVALEWRR